MAENVDTKRTSAEKNTSGKNWYSNLTLEEYKQKRRRREAKENAAMMKLFVCVLIAFVIIVLAALTSKYWLPLVR